jgi:chorismate mutase/prephenate dehydratase
MDLEKFREQINALDEEVLRLLSRRRGLVADIIAFKERQGMQLRDAVREEELLARLIRKGRELGLDAHYVTKVFHEVIDDSVRSQQSYLQRSLNPSAARRLRVAFQGIEGAYSHLAAQKYFAERASDAAFVGYTTFAEVIEAVEEGAADYALLPVENTTAGSVHEVYDLLLRTKLSIVGEEVFRVDHCLLGCELVPLSRIRRVLSHWQALAQCSRFLAQLHDCVKEPFPDTAMAVRKVKEDADPSQAAVASEEAARLYGLKVLQKGIADQPENFTRFLAAAPQPVQVDSRVPSKTSLVLATQHQPGALLSALAVLHRHEVNLTKLESRPKRGSPFEYLFYLDFEGNVAEERVAQALGELRGVTSFLKILGSYPRELRSRTAPRTQALAGEHKPAAAGAAASAPTDAAAAGAETPKARAPARHRLAGRQSKREDTVIRVRGVEVGGADFIVFAGPFLVESRDQIRASAREVKERGGRVLRGGCFTPRTSPEGSHGLGFEGLKLLVEAGRDYDLPVMTEVLAPADVERVADLADILQVGARNMQNSTLLGEVGKVNRPVLLERGMSASLDELLDAAEFVLAQGNHEVILCERGIRTFETTTRNTLDLGAIPILKRLTHLPVVVDPSHAAGQRDLVVPLALAAHAVGPHGMVIEVHPDPDKALSDGPQALAFREFAALLAEVYGKKSTVDSRQSTAGASTSP